MAQYNMLYHEHNINTNKNIYIALRHHLHNN